MNIVNADQGLLDYLIPVRMDQEAEGPEVVYVDILKNPQL